MAPAALEDPIRANPLVGQVVVVGDEALISALITLDPEMLPVWLNNNDEDAGMSLEEACANAAVLAEVQRAIDAANEHVSRAESIRKFTILATELTEASGHLTPKLSIKRNVILEDFSRSRSRRCTRVLRPPRDTRSCTDRFFVTTRARGFVRGALVRCSAPGQNQSDSRTSFIAADARPSRAGRGTGSRRGGRSRAAAPAP